MTGDVARRVAAALDAVDIHHRWTTCDDEYPEENADRCPRCAAIVAAADA